MGTAAWDAGLDGAARNPAVSDFWPQIRNRPRKMKNALREKAKPGRGWAATLQTEGSMKVQAPDLRVQKMLDRHLKTPAYRWDDAEGAPLTRRHAVLARADPTSRADVGAGQALPRPGGHRQQDQRGRVLRCLLRRPRRSLRRR